MGGELILADDVELMVKAGIGDFGDQAGGVSALGQQYSFFHNLR